MIAFHGVFPAIITPMTPEGKLNEAVLREVMEFNIQAGVHGFWVAGGTGESVLLDDEENMRIAEIAADQARGRITNIMHVGALTTARAARMAEHAARVNIDAICCVPPFFYKPSDAAVVEHYRVIAAAANLPFFVYNLPQCTGTEITPELMRKIQERVPQLAGLKHSALTLSYVRDFTKMGLACIIGNSALMLPALTLGATGCIDGPPNMAPEFWIEIWHAYQAGDLKRAEDAQDRATEVTNLVRRFGLHATTKVVLSARLGIDCGNPRPPGLPLTAEQCQQVLTRAAELGLARATVGAH
ncbi:MAG: dihydrodipicolinate synthase family protein [Candidatus Rokubacteria bacterium]|nr:dihydrodipicolinate synthase family protein [Candidatus Rokubacteria bacterium]